MTRIRFQQSLENLKEKLLVEAGLAEQAVQRAIEAYRKRDLSICELERVGNAAKTISERVRHMERMAAAELPVNIPRMAELASEMVRMSLQAFIEADAEAARSILTMDDAVDAMNKAAFKALIKVMEEQSHLAPQALNALMISRALVGAGRRCAPPQERESTPATAGQGRNQRVVVAR